MKRAIIYLRVSTERQATQGGQSEGYSIPAQRAACARKAEALGAEVIDEYVDAGESARSSDRPALQAMLARLKEHADVDYLIVHKLDRLARNRADDVQIALAIRASGAELVSCSENIDDTPAGALLHGIMASIAEFYSKNLATEAKKGLHQKAKAGGTPSRAPIGYVNVSSRIDGREVRSVAVDEERAEHIRWAFQAYATGDYSLTQLTEALEARGLRARKTPRYPGNPLSRALVHRLLSNPYYLGIVRYGGVEDDGNHPALVDVATFRQVQRVLAAHRRSGERSQRHGHYLKGSLVCGNCGNCGSRIALTMSRGKYGVIYPYFYCLGRNKHRTVCDLPFLPVQLVESAVADYYRHVRLSDDELASVRTQAMTHIECYDELAAKELTRQAGRLQRLNRERRKLLEAHYADAIPLDLLKQEQDRIGRETAQAESIIRRCRLEVASLKAALQECLDLLDDCQRTYT